jgi:SAM-dependent methyltransferase
VTAGGERWRQARARLVTIARRVRDRQRRPVASGPLATTDDVRAAYRLILGRDPEPGGLAHWGERLGRMTTAELGDHFLRSSEYRQRWLAQLGRTLDLPKDDHAAPSWSPIASQLVTQAQIDTTLYWHWCNEIRDVPRYHRKQWEYVYLLQALDAAGMLAPGKRGLGFGVGREPTVSVLAQRGCDLLVTDLANEAAAHIGWRDSQQHASTLDELHHAEICDLATFQARVKHRVQDMRAIDDDLRTGGFDFVWSLCAFEHLGSLEDGLRFVRASLDCVRPGGIAVHTTELNVSSNDATVDHGATVLYRRRDIETLVRDLTRDGHEVRLNLHPGDGPLDRYYDLPPYSSDVQLKIEVRGFVTTSLGLMIRRAA